MSTLVLWRESPGRWLGLGLLLVLLAAANWDGLVVLESYWRNREEYSHAYLLPLIALFLLWQRIDRLRSHPLHGAWSGLLLLAAGALVGLSGSLSATYALMQYGTLIGLAGVVVTLLGWRGLALLWPPLALLFFAIPLPEFLYSSLSLQLQLWSSQLGVMLIRAFGISVHLEGNIIDLGVQRLQVAEACSGLRYLFPLLSISFVVAYLYDGSSWRRALVFLAAIPLTVLMNSLRIAVIGVSVSAWGSDVSEGLLHDIEGWVYFMVGTSLLLGLVWLLVATDGSGRSFQDAFAVGQADPPPDTTRWARRAVPPALAGAVLLLGVVVLAQYALSNAVPPTVPVRAAFDTFPGQLGSWYGLPRRLDGVVQDALRADDYLLSEYIDDRTGERVDLYAAYYASQQAGQTTHSPRTCIPGGGWQLTRLDRLVSPDLQVAGSPLRFNRVEISLGWERRLVYYWFQQRGRTIASEYLVKWYLVRDTILTGRSDGALVRLSTPLGAGEEWSDADARMRRFARLAVPNLGPHVPGAP